MTLRIFAALAIAGFSTCAVAADEGKYPDWTAQYARVGGAGGLDPSKPSGNGQQIPLNARMQAYFDSVEANRKAGGLVDNFSTSCVPLGMPRVMINYEIMDMMVTPAATYLWFTESNELRRIYTDGRNFPDPLVPSYLGTSIGEWKDTTGSGKFDTLEVETRGFVGPREYDSAGLPLDRDNQSVFNERFSVDPSKANVVNDVITTRDNGLTRPWTLTRQYRRAKKNNFSDTICALDTAYLILGDENYFISADGFLMPAKKGQKPPDLKYFSNAGK